MINFNMIKVARTVGAKNLDHWGPIIIYFLVNTIAGIGDKLEQKGQDEFVHPGHKGLTAARLVISYSKIKDARIKI